MWINCGNKNGYSVRSYGKSKNGTEIVRGNGGSLVYVLGNVIQPVVKLFERGLI